MFEKQRNCLSENSCIIGFFSSPFHFLSLFAVVFIFRKCSLIEKLYVEIVFDSLSSLQSLLPRPANKSNCAFQNTMFRRIFYFSGGESKEYFLWKLEDCWPSWHFALNPNQCLPFKEWQEILWMSVIRCLCSKNKGKNSLKRRWVVLKNFEWTERSGQ